MLSTEGKCHSCGAVLGVDAIEGFCSRCLAGTAFESVFPAVSGSKGPCEPALSRNLGNYDLLEEIGRGGVGIVYRARQRGLNREVAVKVLRQGPFADSAEVERFRREAEAAAGLHDHRIVAIHEIGEVDGHAFFSMDLVPGRTLAELTREGPLEAARAARYVRSISQAMAAAHAQGVLHRDLKPSNVIIDSDDQPRVTDFGLAKRIDNLEATVTAQLAGSPGYMPPEQADPQRGRPTVGSDIYSLGALFYHLLTGRPPFLGETLGSVLIQVQNVEPIAPRLLNPSVPRDLETICLKCLEKDPRRRYATAKELSHELDRFLRKEPILARPISAPEKLARWCKRQPVLASLAGAVTLLLIALAVGASIAAWRIEQARKAERNEKQKASAAGARLAETVSYLELQRAESFFSSGDPSLGLAHLAAVLRRDPSNHLAAERILSALLHRNWVIRAGPALTHPHYVHALAYNADGTRVVTGCQDGIARVWDVTTRKQIGGGLKHPMEVRGVSFSPDGAFIATACGDGKARIWNWRTGEIAVGPLQHGNWTYAATFSPDGELIATGSGEGTARIWSARTGALCHTLAGHHDQVTQVAFSPDGRLVASVSMDGTVRLWNSQTGEQLRTLVHNAKGIFGVAFSPDGNRLATASRDRIAVIWNVATGSRVSTELRHPDGLVDVRFDPTGRLLATTSIDDSVRLWDAHSGELLSQPFRHDKQVSQAAFSPDGRTLATASFDGRVCFWDILPGPILQEPMRHGDQRGRLGALKWAEFSPDGKRIATASYDQTARVWDAENGLAITGPLPHSALVISATFSSDSKLLVTVAGRNAWLIEESWSFPSSNPMILNPSDDGAAWIWNAETGAKVKGPFVHGPLWAASLSPDSRRLVTASEDSTARIWDVETMKEIAPALRHAGEVRIARFSPDGTRVVTASADGSARVWDAGTGAAITKNLLHRDKLRDARFSPDGLMVATASMDDTAKLWDARTGRQIGRTLQHARTVESVNFSPDGHRVVTASLDHSARIWDTATGEPLIPPITHDEGIWHACFGPDGRRVATAGMDGMARIWDAATGLPLSEPLRHKGPVRTAQFGPAAGSQRLVTATMVPDNAARIWEVPPGPGEIPDCLADFAEAVAGVAVGPHGTTRLVTESEFNQIKQRLTAIPTNDLAGNLARWFFTDRRLRPISPFARETTGEYVQRRIDENTAASLEEAVRLDPTNALALARLARTIQPSDGPDAAALAKRALRFDPNQGEASEVLNRSGP